jgi:S-adenosylmethionine synthetase
LLVSTIGHPIHAPQIVDVQIRPRGDASVAALAHDAQEIIHANLRSLGSMTADLLSGSIRLDRWPLRG